MNSSTSTLAVVLVILIICSAFFSASETAYSALNKIRIKNKADSGNKRAKLTLRLLNDFDNLLSGILLLNNVINIVSATLATLLFVSLLGSSGATVATIVMTGTILFAEITPKTIVKEVPEQYAMFAAPVMRVVLFIFKPINFLLAAWKRMLLKIVKINQNRTATEEEFLTYVDVVQQEGGINKQEAEMIKEAIEFDELKVIDIFTPRVDVVAAEINQPVETIAALYRENGYSRIPVYENSIDNIIGIAIEKDFLYHVLPGEKSLEDILRPTVFTPKSAKISPLLKKLQKEKIHMAVVVDDFGGTLGIITVEDIVEELVGDIWDEHDKIVEQILETEDGAFWVSANTELPAFNARFKTDIQSTATTIGGWVIETLNHIPQEQEKLTYQNLTITVSKVLRHRVLELTVTVQKS